MESDGLIKLFNEERKRKIYQITDLRQEILEIEINRIKRMYNNIKGEVYCGN